MRVGKFVTVLAALGAAAPSIAAAQVEERSQRRAIESDFAPPIDLWLDQISYDRGARMRPYFTTEPGAYVVVVRVTSDGELRVMYPERPGEQRPYVPGEMRNNVIPYSGDPSLILYESSGSGFVFAIASYQRFDFRAFTQGRRWNGARLAMFGRNGDPFHIVREFVDAVLPQNADFSLDYEVYEVYSRGRRSVYAGSYAYSSLSDYHDACLTAFGIRYNYYCRSYGGLYYGPIIVSSPRPRPVSPRGPKIKGVRPVVPDPMVPTGPLDPQRAEGRFPESDAAERAARQRYERLQRKVAPRTPGRDPIVAVPRVEQPRRREASPSGREREPVIYRSMPSRAQPRSEPRPVAPSQPRVEGRMPMRSEPRAPARVEVRNEPRPAPPRIEARRPEKQNKEN